MSQTAQLPWSDFIGDLERDKKAIEDLLAAHKAFQDRLASLPTHLAARISDTVKVMAGTLEGEVAVVSPKEKPFAGKTGLECAKLILKEHGNQPMHFGAIAKEALQRGYEGKSLKEGSNPEAREFRTAQSFWAMMHRAERVFEKTDGGYFKLKNADGKPTESDNEKNQSAPKQAKKRTGESLVDRIVALLREAGKPMRGKEIATALEAAGVTTTAKFGLLAMVLSALRKQPKLFKRHERGIYSLYDENTNGEQP